VLDARSRLQWCSSQNRVVPMRYGMSVLWYTVLPFNLHIDKQGLFEISPDVVEHIQRSACGYRCLTSTPSLGNVPISSVFTFETPN
jgi:hypothetical protein